MTVATLKCAVRLGLVVCAIGGASAAAQFGQITGLVIDATGGVLPGATVTLRGGPDGRREAQTGCRACVRRATEVLLPGKTRQNPAELPGFRGSWRQNFCSVERPPSGVFEGLKRCEGRGLGEVREAHAGDRESVGSGCGQRYRPFGVAETGTRSRDRRDGCGRGSDFALCGVAELVEGLRSRVEIAADPDGAVPIDGRNQAGSFGECSLSTGEKFRSCSGECWKPANRSLTRRRDSHVWQRRRDAGRGLTFIKNTRWHRKSYPDAAGLAVITVSAALRPRVCFRLWTTTGGNPGGRRKPDALWISTG